MEVTCDIEVSIAGSLANFVRDDALIDATVCMTHRADDQAVDVADYRGKQRWNDASMHSVSIAMQPSFTHLKGLYCQTVYPLNDSRTLVYILSPTGTRNFPQTQCLND